MGNHSHQTMPPRDYRPSSFGPNQPGSRPQRPAASAPPILGEHHQTRYQMEYSSHAEEQESQYRYVEYAPYYPAPMTGYEDYRPDTAPLGTATPRAATFAAPPLARTASLGMRVRNGLRRIGRSLDFRRRRRVVVTNEDLDGDYDYGDCEYSEAELEQQQRRPCHRQASRRFLSRPPTAAEGAEENPSRALVARAVFFDGIVDRHGNLASSPPVTPVTPVTNPPGPSAAARRRAKFSGDDDDLYYETVGRDAESGVTYREARYK